MTTGGAKARLFVEHDLEQGRSVDLSPDQAHYLKHVLRMSTNDHVILFNGRDGEWAARIEDIGRGWGSVQIKYSLRPQVGEPDLWLVFAPIKRARLDFLIQKAVELGVSRIIPVYTDRTEVKRLNHKRHQANIIEAAEQCERLSLPELLKPVALDEMLKAFPRERRLLVCAERGAAMPLRNLSGGGDVPPADWAILCGPEGGFSHEELDEFSKLNFITFVSLGPRILRSETAAVSAIACWQSVWGDWQARPPELG